MINFGEITYQQLTMEPFEHKLKNTKNKIITNKEIRK